MRISCNQDQKTEVQLADVELALTYRLVNATSIEGLHSPISSAGVVILDKAVVVSFAAEFLLGFVNQSPKERE